MKRIAVILCSALFWAEVGNANRLEPTSLSEIGQNGAPLGYKVSVYVPLKDGVRSDGRGYVSSASDDGAALLLELPTGQNFELDLEKPLELEMGKRYQFEVMVKWEGLNGAGPGIASFGPCFAIYVHGEKTARVAVIKASPGLNGWATVQIAFDTNQFPDLVKPKIFFRSFDVVGRVWLKEALLKELDELPPKHTSFILPSGEMVAHPVLAP